MVHLLSLDILIMKLELENKMKMKRSLEERITRLEVLHNLESVPKEWNITVERMKSLRNLLGRGFSEIKRNLASVYGEKLPEEE